MHLAFIAAEDDRIIHLADIKTILLLENEQPHYNIGRNQKFFILFRWLVREAVKHRKFKSALNLQE